MADKSGPIWKPVVASLISSAILWAASQVWNWLRFYHYQIPPWLAVLFMGIAAILAFLHYWPEPSPKISLIDSWPSRENTKKLDYPLKLMTEFENKSSASVEVRLAKYAPNKLQALKRTRRCLQVFTYGVWSPPEHSDYLVSVAPSEFFRVWIPLDPTMSDEAIRGYRGQAGTLTLKIDNKDMSFDL